MTNTPLPARSRHASSSLPPTAEDRERVASFLSERFTADAITLEQFDERVGLVYRAATRAELDAIAADLGARPVSSSAPPAIAIADTTPPHGRRFAVLSNLEQHIIVVPRVLDVSAVLGNVELDLSASRFGAGATDINVNAIFGHIGIKLPSGAVVEQRTGSYLGSCEIHPSPVSASRRTGPTIVITGAVVLGAVEISFAAPPAARVAGGNRLDSPRRRS